LGPYAGAGRAPPTDAREVLGRTLTVHLLTTATLDRLRELYPKGRFEVRRFRPNIVVEPASDEKSFVEKAWIGHTICIGDQVRLNISGPCPRCVMTTLPQGDLPRDPGILRAAAQHNKVNVGVYAAVLRGGPIRRGDAVRIGVGEKGSAVPCSRSQESRGAGGLARSVITGAATKQTCWYSLP
jgi:uncharacterized protein YcbX